MVDTDTPKEANKPKQKNERKETQVPKPKSDWPDIALFTTADGQVLEPGDEGYDNVNVNRRFASEIKKAEDSAKELREIRNRIHKAVSDNTVPLSSRDAVRASLANDQRARTAQDSQKQQLRERLSEMGLLPD